MLPASNFHAVDSRVSLSEEEFPRTFLGLESASEMDSLSSVFDRITISPADPTNGVQANLWEFNQAKLCDLDPSAPWSPSIVLKNIISVPLETDYFRLEKLLLMTTYYEKRLGNHIPKANSTTISLLSKQLNALHDLIEKIQKRINILMTSEKLDFKTAVHAEKSGSSANVFSGLLSWVSHRSHKDDPIPGKLLTDIAEVEWSLETIHQQEKLLNEANIVEVQKLALLTVDQVSCVWAKQQKAIKLLEKEQSYISYLSLLKVLKIATQQQINNVRPPPSKSEFLLG